MKTIYSMLYIAKSELNSLTKDEMRDGMTHMQWLQVNARVQAGTMAYESKAEAIKAARKLNRESEYTRALVYELTLL